MFGWLHKYHLGRLHRLSFNPKIILKRFIYGQVMNLDRKINQGSCISNWQIHYVSGKGACLVSTKTFASGELIGLLDGHKVPKPTKLSVYSEGAHIDPTNGLQNLNHSCDPNAHFRGGELRARKPILPGSEVTIDYRHTEPSITHSFTCVCGSANCAGKIQ